MTATTPMKFRPTKCDPAKRDPTKRDPTKRDPTKRDPTKRDPTKLYRLDAALVPRSSGRRIFKSGTSAASKQELKHSETAQLPPPDDVDLHNHADVKDDLIPVKEFYPPRAYW
jgi:hypothetical protein